MPKNPTITVEPVAGTVCPKHDTGAPITRATVVPAIAYYTRRLNEGSLRLAKAKKSTTKSASTKKKNAPDAGEEN